MANNAPQAAAATRRLKVEKLYLLGYPPRKIYEAIGDQYDISFETIKRDVVLVRSAWREQLEELRAGDCAADYLQMALSDRRDALKKGDIRTAYAIAKDLAIMTGVKFIEHRANYDGGTIEVEWQAPVEDDDAR